ncbi:Alpha/Beta hydrolase protein [Gymnopilus junonius]|uniref:Carboxylic ester hydrolase n=1 Tax=Gymnopilus junonius TaxID=109634 RepID=A0A9P5TKP0_GYMJU|nr:Alpha/Beta hydrolase protein [Gymnopilus junonius]
MLLLALVGFTGLLCASVIADPVVKLDNATISGFNDDSVSKFLGIPYAYPPTGQLRFRPPKELGPYKSPINATVYGPACPQQKLDSPFAGVLPSNATALLRLSPLFKDAAAALAESEDCLSINVLRPSFVDASHKLPVVVVRYACGFEVGYTEQYDGQAVRIVQRSVKLNQPVVLVHMNYRYVSVLLTFGFLGGKEVYDEGVGNLGLVDQRAALRWVNKYIGQFGGDNSKVTLWGESAGAISIAMQMLAYGGDTSGYFHAAFMQSGATLPVGSIKEGQVYYDFIVEQTGCKGNPDTLNCLRRVDYSSLALAYVPRADGLILTDDPHKLVQSGLVAKIPIVSGNCDDEGTAFALSSRNITSEDQFREYVNQFWIPKAPAKELEPLWSLYTSNLPEGSPFNTGYLNGLTRQFKRMAAFQGDAFFQAPRRFFLKNLSGKQKIWSYLAKQLKWVPYLGSFHFSDLLVNLTDDYLINFANKHDPNIGNGPAWPEYTAENPQLYTFPTLGSTPTVILDNYRAEQFEFLTNISLKYPN